MKVRNVQMFTTARSCWDIHSVMNSSDRYLLLWQQCGIVHPFTNSGVCLARGVSGNLIGRSRLAHDVYGLGHRG